MKKIAKLMAFVIAFAMVASFVVLPASAYVGNIAGTVTGITDNVVTATGMPKASDAAGEPKYEISGSTATFSNGVISITNRKYNNCSTGVALKNLAMEAGKKYKLSVEIRRDSDVWCNNGKDENGDGVFDYTAANGKDPSDTKVVDNLNARYVFSPISGSTVTAATSELANTALTNKNQWYKLTAEVDVMANDAGTVDKGINLTFKVGRNSNNNTFDYSVRNLTITEVNPVEADLPTGVDILSYYGFDGSFESLSSGQTSAATYTFKHPDANATTVGAALSSIKVETGVANTGTQSVAPTTTGENRLRIVYVPVDAGSVYEVSAYIKLKDAPEAGRTVSARFTGGQSGNTRVNASFTSSGNAVINSTEFTKITGLLKVTAKSGSETQQYSHAHVKLETYDGSTKSNTEDVYVDDWTITEMPKLTAASAVEDGAVKFTFNNDIKAATADNIVVSPATATANVSKNGKVVTVTLSDYEYEQTYTISTKDITDIYGQTLAAAATASYTTEEAPLLSPAPITDVVDVANEVFQAGARESHAVTKVADNEWTVVKGTAELEKWTTPKKDGGEFGYTATQVKTDNVQRTSYKVEKGKKYVITALVKSEDATPDAAATVTATVGESGDSAHNIDAYGASNPFSIATNDWVQVYQIVTVANGTACNCANGNCTKKNSVLHYGVSTNEKNVSFRVKDLAIRELKPLAYDESFLAFTVDNGDGTATLYITNATTTNVYFAAAAYAQDGKLTDVKFGAGVADENGEAIKITVPENYKVMIWDGNMKPLHNTFLGSDF